MDDAKRDLVRAWFLKARNDLDTARQIGSLPDGHLDTAVFHCQQAAEKALKGFLAFNDHPLHRSHDLEHLLELAETYQSGFSLWDEAAAILTPYATAYRYPGESTFLEPTRHEFDEALKLANGVATYAFSLLPDVLR